mmetsp:Transcript_63372/g.137193  ORF Transcript_63372/g.137193 Transcript_63372/m.137193 type:complete len:224 (+) Transcript_63372:641-1312(+)
MSTVFATMRNRTATSKRGWPSRCATFSDQVFGTSTGSGSILAFVSTAAGFAGSWLLRFALRLLELSLSMGAEPSAAGDIQEGSSDSLARRPSMVSWSCAMAFCMLRCASSLAAAPSFATSVTASSTGLGKTVTTCSEMPPRSEATCCRRNWFSAAIVATWESCSLLRPARSSSNDLPLGGAPGGGDFGGPDPPPFCIGSFWGASGEGYVASKVRSVWRGAWSG